MATRSRPHKDSTRNGLASSRKGADARVSDLLLLEELHAQLPVGLLVNDADTLEILRAKPPLPGLAASTLSPDQLVEFGNEERIPRLSAELTSLLQEVAATGTPRFLPEFRHESPGEEARWWTATLYRLDTDHWGRVLVTLAVDLSDQVRARHLLEEREQRHLALRQTIAAVPGHSLASSLQEVADALVPALQVDAAALRLLDTDAKLHLVAASGLRLTEKRRLACEPITPRRLERMVESVRHPLMESFAFRWVEVRWLEVRDDQIGILTVGSRSKRRPSGADTLLDAAAAQLSDALATVERSPGFLRSRSLEMARLSTDLDETAQTPPRGIRPRELAILRLYSEGLGTGQIADLLVLSPHTVRTHVRNARRRLGVRTRDEALELLKATDAGPVI